MQKRSKKLKAPKAVSVQPVCSASDIAEEQILQISNDISEAMCSAKRADIMAVAAYWADRASETAIELEALRSMAQIGLATLSLKLNRKTPNDGAKASGA